VAAGLAGSLVLASKDQRSDTEIGGGPTGDVLAH
jgi:hypothetical protein